MARSDRTVNIRRAWMAVAGLLVAQGCDGGPLTSPDAPQPSRADLLEVDGVPPAANPWDTLWVTYRATANQGTPVPNLVVRVSAPRGGGTLARDSLVTDGEGRARVAWSLGPAMGEHVIRAEGSGVVTTASVTVSGIVAAVRLEPAEFRLAEIGDSVSAEVTALDSAGRVVVPLAEPEIRQIAEERAVSQLPVVATPPGRTWLRATGPGRAQVIAILGAIASEAADVVVSTSQAIVASIEASSAVEPGDTIVLRGYQLDRLAESDIHVTGGTVTLVGRDSATLRLTPTLPRATDCEGRAVATISVPAVVLTDLRYRARRDGEVDLEPGEWARLANGATQCVRLPPAPDAEYALLYFDTRAVELARFGPEPESFPYTSLAVTVADRSGAPVASGTAPGTAPGAAPAARTASHLRMSPMVAAAPSGPPQDFFLFRQTPWATGDRFSIYGTEPFTYDGGTVLRVYDRFVIGTLDGDSAFQVSARLSELPSVMADLEQFAIPVYQQALGAEFPVTTPGSGQLLILITADLDAPAATYMTGGAPAGGVWIALNPGVSTDLDNPLWFDLRPLAHELAHAWQDRHLSNVCRDQGLCGGGTGWLWSVEGGAEFLAMEAARAKRGYPLTANVSLWDIWSDLPLLWSLTQPGGLNVTWLYGFGYGSAEWFLRDLVTRAVAEGQSYADAIAAVTRGALEGWFGFSRDGPRREGLYSRVTRLLGREWDPVEALVTGGISLAVDDLTLNDVLQHDYILRAWERLTPTARFRTGDGLLVSLNTLGWSFGYVRVADDGLGGSYQAATSVAGVEWALARVR